MKTMLDVLIALRNAPDKDLPFILYEFGEPGEELVDLEYAIKYSFKYYNGTSYSSILFCDSGDLMLNPDAFLTEHYNSLAEVDTKSIFQKFENTIPQTVLQSALFVECCMINLYNSEYFKIKPGFVRNKLIKAIYLAAKEDLDQLLRDGGYAAIVKTRVLNKIRNILKLIVHYDISTDDLYFENLECTFAGDKIYYTTESMPYESLVELNSVLNDIMNLMKYK